jgi:hypothetical protein
MTKEEILTLSKESDIIYDRYIRKQFQQNNKQVERIEFTHRYKQ